MLSAKRRENAETYIPTKPVMVKSKTSHPLSAGGLKEEGEETAPTSKRDALPPPPHASGQALAERKAHVALVRRGSRWETSRFFPGPWPGGSHLATPSHVTRKRRGAEINS